MTKYCHFHPQQETDPAGNCPVCAAQRTSATSTSMPSLPSLPPPALDALKREIAHNEPLRPTMTVSRVNLKALVAMAEVYHGALAARNNLAIKTSIVMDLEAVLSATGCMEIWGLKTKLDEARAENERLNAYIQSIPCQLMSAHAPELEPAKD